MRSISRTFRHPLATETAVDSRLTFSFAKKNKRKAKTTFTGSAAKEKLKETLTSASHCASTLKQKTHIPTHTHRHTYILCFIKQQNCFNLQYSGVTFCTHLQIPRSIFQGFEPLVQFRLPISLYSLRFLLLLPGFVTEFSFYTFHFVVLSFPLRVFIPFAH